MLLLLLLLLPQLLSAGFMCDWEDVPLFLQRINQSRLAIPLTFNVLSVSINKVLLCARKQLWSGRWMRGWTIRDAMNGGVLTRTDENTNENIVYEYSSFRLYYYALVSFEDDQSLLGCSFNTHCYAMDGHNEMNNKLIKACQLFMLWIKTWTCIFMQLSPHQPLLWIVILPHFAMRYKMFMLPSFSSLKWRTTYIDHISISSHLFIHDVRRTVWKLTLNFTAYWKVLSASSLPLNCGKYAKEYNSILLPIRVDCV